MKRSFPSRKIKNLEPTPIPTQWLFQKSDALSELRAAKGAVSMEGLWILVDFSNGEFCQSAPLADPN